MGYVNIGVDDRWGISVNFAREMFIFLVMTAVLPSATLGTWYYLDKRHKQQEEERAQKKKVSSA